MREPIRRGMFGISFFILMVSIVAAQEPPPRTIVITPQAPATPDKPGFITIRPNSPTPEGPRRPINPSLETPTPGTTTKSATAPSMKTLANPVPVQNPVPIPEGATAPPEDPVKAIDQGKLLLESYDTAYLKGQPIGYFHVRISEREKDGKKYIYASKLQRLTVARFGQVVEQWAEDVTLEDPASGQILAVRMAQGLSREQKLSLAGSVQGNKL
ncbi:MAG: hypothetical protein ACRCZF_14965, partial [Gemmataceae bacterium]